VLDSYVIFAAPGIDDRDGRWYGSVVTDDITILPNPAISTSASMFLDNDNGQVWEFFSDHSGNFGVFDKATETEAFEMSPRNASHQYDVSISGGLSLIGHFTGGIFTQTAGSVTIGPEDFTQLLNGTTTAQLPSAAGSNKGRIVTVKQIAAGSASVTTTSSQTIDGAASYTLSAQYKYVTVQSDGSNWFIIANN
jgi:hypothetical protein